MRYTLRELQVHRSTFYAWYRRYTEHGQAGPFEVPHGGAAEVVGDPRATPVLAHAVRHAV